MTREILFRGFHPCEDGKTTIYVEGEAVKGRWVEGGYAEIAPPPVCFSSDPQEPIKTCIVAEKGFADWGMPRQYGMYDTLPSTVCPYTGLTNKNGRRIFEGDMILEKGTGYKAVVEWQPDTCRFLAIITNRRDEQSPHFFYVDKGNDRGCQMSSNEVIGTIWDKEDDQ